MVNLQAVRGGKQSGNKTDFVNLCVPNGKLGLVVFSILRQDYIGLVVCQLQ